MNQNAKKYESYDLQKDYLPKKEIGLLNEQRENIVCVLCIGKQLVYTAHRHLNSEDNLPFLHEAFLCRNSCSVSIPKKTVSSIYEGKKYSSWQVY